MSIQKVEWMEKKNEDWIIATLKSENGVALEEVSINRKNKKGEVFPKFDEIVAGADVEGELWQSSAGKWYLFAPKAVKMAVGGAYKGQMMEKAMDKKNESIARFQGDKELSIKIASTFSQSVALAIAEFQANRQTSVGGPSLEVLQKKWRDYCWTHYDFNESVEVPPFNN